MLGPLILTVMDLKDSVGDPKRATAIGATHCRQQQQQQQQATSNKQTNKMHRANKMKG